MMQPPSWGDGGGGLGGFGGVCGQTCVVYTIAASAAFESCCAVIMPSSVLFSDAIEVVSQVTGGVAGMAGGSGGEPGSGGGVEGGGGAR